MWSCLPSIFKPDVGPRVESDAGEPASPKAAATPMMDTVASGEKPKDKQSGTYLDVIIGTVEKEEPIPMVISKPTSSIKNAAKPLL